MKCEFCDEECKHEHEHFKEVCNDNGDVIWECSGWTCPPMDWRKRALEAEAKIKILEANIHQLWSTTHA